MKITGSVSAIANLLVTIDNIYEDYERELQADKAREKPILLDEMMTYMDSRKSMSTFPTYVSDLPRFPKSKSEYPKPREIADAYIKQFGKKYDREIAKDFIKGYLHGRRLTNKYRRRVLMSIVDIVNDSAKNLKNYKHGVKVKSNGKKRTRIIRDWDALAREYLTLEPQPSMNRFMKDRKIGLGKTSYDSLRKSLANIKNTILGTKPPVFSTATTSSVG